MNLEPAPQQAVAPNTGTHNDADLVIVGIGAAEGGLEPLSQLLAQLPSDSSMAFLVILRLSPEELRDAPTRLQQHTVLPVLSVSAPTTIVPNHIYVIPPDRHLTMVDGRLELTEREHVDEQRAPIDLFFRTLAEAHGSSVAAIVLSGYGADGAMGVQRVKEREGLTLAQIPEEAAFVEMPYNAIATGMVDYVLPITQMPAQLLDYGRRAERIAQPAQASPAAVDEPRASVDDEAALREIFATLRVRTGHDFSQYKRSTLFRRIGRRIQVTNADSLAAYRDVLRSNPGEVQALLRDLLISVTNFFRDRDAWALLESIVPQLFAGKQPHDQVRVWVAGCATGEEAYSVAMLLHEHAALLQQPPAIQIFATDIDEAAIATARQGIYPTTIAVDVPPERLGRYFIAQPRHYRVNKEIRDLVLFAPHNLLRDPPFSKLDLVSCRNLLIYLNREVQSQIMQLFHFSLRPNGYLLLGSAETTDGIPGLFAPLDTRQRLFQRQEAQRTQTLAIPTVPLLGIEQARPAVARQVLSAPDHGFGDLHQQLLAQHALPSVIVDANYDLIHISRGAGRFLQLAEGEASSNLLRLVHPDLRLDLRTALFATTQPGPQVEVRQVRITLDGQPRLVELRVQMISEPVWAQGSVLVVFNDMADLVTVERPGTSHVEPMVRELEAELRKTKEQLRLTLEQHDTAVEEYRATNEELQAMNEEQRATAEELETSKEELQSINEELTTINAALGHKVEEVSQANSDLQNLMAATQIATLFIDRELQLTRYTPTAQAIFNVIPTDIGRPLRHITHQLVYDTLLQDAARVRDMLQAIEREVYGLDERTYLARLQPYRTTDDRIDGVVLTFVDITARKQAEDALRESVEALRASEEQFRRAVEDAPIPVLMHAEDGQVLQLSRRWTELTGYTLADVPTLDTWLTQAEGDGADTLRKHLRDLFADDRRILNVDLDVRIRTGDLRHWSFSASSPGTLRDGRRFLVSMAVDLSERIQTEAALRESDARFRTLANAVPQVIWTNNADGKATYFNQRWYEYSGLSYEQSAGPGWQVIVHPDDAPASVERWHRALAAGEMFDTEYRLRRADGMYRWHLGRNMPLRDGEGRIAGWFGSATDIEDLKQAEAAVRESEERFRLLVEGARDYAMFLLDPANRITFWSVGAERVFGWSEAEALGQSGVMIFTPEDRANGAPEQEIDTARNQGRAADQRWHLKRDGSRFWADGVLVRLDDEHGMLRGFVKITRDATERKQAEEALQRAHDDLERRVEERTAELQMLSTTRQELLQRLVMAQEDERRRIARELHDSLGQYLSALRLDLTRAQTIEGCPPAVQTSMARQLAITTEIDAELDQLTMELRPPALDDLGLNDALARYTEEWSATSGIPADMVATGFDTTRLSMAVEAAAYRIVQEALTNVRKHAHAHQVSVLAERHAGRLQVIIEDDGVGFDLEAVQRDRSAGRQLGLVGMAERATLVGGTMTIESQPGGGTTIYLHIPIGEERQKRAGEDHG
jgi:two-component system, chemotaxis family, CheB/CheR fusion protein